MSKVTKQGEPGLGPKSPDSLLKTIPYISCSATKHPFTHECTHACTRSCTPIYLSHHKSIHSQRVSAPIGHSVLPPLPCLVGHWNPLHSPLHQRSLFRVPLKSPCRSSPHFQPQSVYLQGGLRDNLSSPHFQEKVPREKGTRTHCHASTHNPSPDSCAGICKVPLAKLSLVSGQPPHFPY